MKITISIIKPRYENLKKRIKYRRNHFHYHLRDTITSLQLQRPSYLGAAYSLSSVKQTYAVQATHPLTSHRFFQFKGCMQQSVTTIRRLERVFSCSRE